MIEPMNPISSAEQDEGTILDFLTIIVENLKLLVFGPMVVGIFAFGVSFLVTPTFTARTTMIPPSQNNGVGGTVALLGQLGGLGAFAGGATGIKTPTDQYLAYLESNTLRDQLIQKFKLRERYQVKYQQDARDVLKENAKITAYKKSGLIQIEVDDEDPQFAANLANAYVESLGNMVGQLAIKEARVKRELLEYQITEAIQKSYQSPVVREAIIQSLIREYETARLDETRGASFFAQMDVAEVPELKTKPKKALVALVSTLAAEFLLLLFVFIRASLSDAEENLEFRKKLSTLKNLIIKQLNFK